MRDVGHLRRQVRGHLPRSGHGPPGLLSDSALQPGNIHPGPRVAQVNAELDGQVVAFTGYPCWRDHRGYVSIRGPGKRACSPMKNPTNPDLADEASQAIRAALQATS
jgi:hypothetical protein